MSYFLQYAGHVVGPMTKEQLVSYNITENTPVSTDGVNFRPLYTYPELMDMYAHLKGRQSPEGDSKKLVCGILAILAGGLGLQYFLIGKVAGGIINICLSLVTCGLWSVVTIIQGIMILCMSDAEWHRKYVDSTSTFPVF